MRKLILVLTMALLNFGLAAAATTRFTDNGNETVTDNVTTLIWQKCSMGQTADATCTGTARTDTWANAIIYCEGLTLGGSSAWRLPQVKELRSIVDNTDSSAPVINATYFPATVSSFYWSATTYVPSSTNAWIVGFDDGSVSSPSKSFNNYVRCVR